MVVTKQKYTEKQELVAKYGNALGNPVRVAILELLSKQSCCFHGDMAEELPIANSTLSQHLKVLKDLLVMNLAVLSSNNLLLMDI